jgi:hypothetical protein
MVNLSVADETERVTCRIRIDPPAALAVAVVKQRGSEPEGLFLGLSEILDPEVQVELLRPSGIWPLRRPVVLYALESEHQPGAGMEGRPAIIQRPARIGLVHHAAEKGLVETGELEYVSAVQHDALNVGDHDCKR